MINSKLKNETRGYDYPKLMVMKDKEYREEVVLFVSDRCGTLVSSTNDYDLKIGDYSNNWSMGSFEIFNGEVLISNK